MGVDVCITLRFSGIGRQIQEGRLGSQGSMLGLNGNRFLERDWRTCFFFALYPLHFTKRAYDFGVYID